MLNRISYEVLVETLEVLGDVDTMVALRQGLREARAGKAIPWEQAKKKLIRLRLIEQQVKRGGRDGRCTSW